MDDAAKKALDMVEAGLAKMGEVAPGVWKELVQYNLAVTVGEQIALILTFAVGMVFLFKVGLPQWNAYEQAKDEGARSASVIKGLVGHAVGTVCGLTGLIGTLTQISTTLATIYAPQAGLVMKLISKTTK